MNIAFYGSSLVSAYWNGAATYYRGLIRNLHALGHRVTFFEPDAFERQQHRDLADPEWARVVVYPATIDGVSRALEMGKDADILIKASGVGVFDSLLEEAVLSMNKPAVFWDVDAPATLDRLHADSNDPFRSLIPRYAMILTYGGGPPVQSAYRALGAHDCIPIYNALDPATHYPVAPEKRFECDVSFLGHRLPDREARVEEFFFSPAARLPRSRFVLAGNAWENKAMTPNVRYLGYVSPAEHNAFNCTPRAVLNIARDSMARYGWGPATRVFESAGVGACLITDAWKGLEDFLEPNLEVLVAHSGAEVAAHVASLTEARAREIGAASRRRILAEHTYEHRAREVHRILTGNRAFTRAASQTAVITAEAE
jgi:spore maturation protein CgeB